MNSWGEFQVPGLKFEVGGPTRTGTDGHGQGVNSQSAIANSRGPERLGIAEFWSEAGPVSIRCEKRPPGWAAPDRKEFFRLLSERGMTLKKLADAIGSSHPRVSQAINEVPGRGRVVRRRLLGVLTREEIAALGWDVEVRYVVRNETGYALSFRLNPSRVELVPEEEAPSFGNERSARMVARAHGLQEGQFTITRRQRKQQQTHRTK